MKRIIVLSLFILSFNTFAVNLASVGPLLIKKVYFYSLQEPVYPSHKGVLQVFFEGDFQWNNTTTCNTSSAVIRHEDTHMISAILSAKLSATPINIYADDRFMVGSECYLRAVGY